MPISSQPCEPAWSRWLVLTALAMALGLSATGVRAQGTQSDYQRAQSLSKRVSGRVFREKVQPHWLPAGTRFWYRVTTGRETHEFILVDAEKGTRQPAFDHQRLAEGLKKAGVVEARADRLSLDRLTFPTDSHAVQFRCGGKGWRCDLDSYELRPRDESEGSTPPAPPDKTPRPSSRTGAETTLIFVNRTDGEVGLFWLDERAHRRSYGKLRPGEEHAQHTFAGHVWLVIDAAGEPLGVFEAEEETTTAEIRVSAKETSQATPPAKPAAGASSRPHDVSPDGQWRAFLKDHNVWVQKLPDGEARALSNDGSEEDAYRDGFHWSPDSKRLVALRVRQGDERKVYYVESSPADQVQPKLHSYFYLKPGDRVPLESPHLFDVAEARAIPIGDDLFANPWDISDFRWAADSSRFTFQFNQRGHQVLRIVAVDAATGHARAIVDEQSKSFIDYAHKHFVHYLDATGEILWMSERDGWNHLYLYDAATGRVKNQVTRGPWVVRGVDRVDDEARQIWFRAGGIRPGQDPYYVHICRVNFDGSGLVVLTEGDGTHKIDYSPDGKLLIDTWSRVDQPPVTELRRTADGSLVCELERANWSQLLATGWRPPERFVAKGRDGTTDIYGVILRPTNFDPAKKYPVVEEIYAGPQGSYVPKGFSAYSKAMSLAELGFIVVKIDGMGTSNRSKAFHDVCWKNLVDAGFPDRILWMQAAAKQYPSLDLSRVGVYGGSAGGQNALAALLTHGNFYRAAVADCGCHDNRMDKIWWNELWMGWPVGPQYEQQSNVTLAKNLQGKLLLMVGEMDENVDPASTMQVVNALVKADKDFDLLVIPGSGHGSAETPYGTRRRQDFLVRHLLGVEPRSRP